MIAKPMPSFDIINWTIFGSFNRDSLLNIGSQPRVEMGLNINARLV